MDVTARIRQGVLRVLTTRKRVVGFVILVVLSSLVAFPSAYFLNHALANATCVHNLEQIGAALRTYASGAKGERYPLLSRKPGCLMFDSEGFYPVYLKDASLLISAVHPRRKELRQLAAQDATAAIDDHSYWYTGYVFSTTRSVQEWTDEYRQVVPKGGKLSEGLELESRARGSEEKPRQARESEMLFHDEYGTFWNVYFRFELREGIERFFVSDINTPAPPPVRDRIPIMFERPELHGNGGHVLYMDGHVEFVPYPGPFPMTKEFVEGLRSLDELESQAPSKAAPNSRVGD